MRVATRSAHDPPSTIGAPQVIRLGEGPEASGCPNNSVCRYGDYFGAARDPSDPGIVWVAGEYGTATGWATFIAAMAQTVQLTLAYSVQGGGSAYLPPTLAYVRGGQNLTVPLATAPTAYAVDAGTAWSVSAVLGGSGADERWATNDTVSGIATGSESLTFHYSHQFSASFAYRVTGGGSGYASPSVSYTQFAQAITNAANFTDWVDAGGAYAFPLSLGGSNASERWQAPTASANGTVGAAGTIEIAYRHQAFLTFGFQGPAESTMSPGSGWYDVGASVTPSVNRTRTNVSVAGPAQVTANFSLSAAAALAYYSAIAAVGIIAALVLVAVAFRRRRRRSEPPPPPPEPPLPPPPPP